MKRNLIPEPDEFFVGYLPDAPPKTSSFLKKVIVLIGLTMVLVAVLISVSQKKFSTTNFEYGKFTQVEGYIFKKPVPHIRQLLRSDSSHQLYKTILLVGSGKFGAEKALAEFESRLGSLEGKFVSVSGEMIYDESKTLLQVVNEHVPVLLNQPPMTLAAELRVESQLTLQGEIVDPKCYFGVMKPGEGKPHRSCAIRCIAGGIPPVFRVNDKNEHYILLDENFNPINDLVLAVVGDNITLTGRSVQFDNWKILLVDKKNLVVQAKAAILLRTRMAMEKDITLCR